MKNANRLFITIIILFFCLPTIMGQIHTTTSKKCYLLYEYNGKDFEKKKKVKEGSPIILLRNFDKFKGYYIVKYNDQEYYLDKRHINNEGVLEFEKRKADSLKRVREIEDSIQFEKLAIARAIEKRKNDSIMYVNRIKDSINQVRLDSIKNFKIRMATLILKKHLEDQNKLVKAGMPIEIEYLSTSNPNSAGGTDLYFSFKNISPKTIKYISVTGYPINPVKDKCYCSIRHYSQTTTKGVGPISSDEYAEYTWENIWYNHTIDQYIPISINIQYMNGTSINIAGEKLKKMMATPLLDDIYNELLKEYDIDLEEIIKDL